MCGLGNQLYQYAMYEKLKSLGKEVKLDLYAYKQATGEDREWRDLELEYFPSLKYEVCTMEDRRIFLDNSLKLHDRIRRKLTGRKNKTYDEANRAYIPEIFDMDDVYLYGYWICDKYYEDIIPLLQEKIVFPESDNPKNFECMEKMKTENAVSIHVRRSDFLTTADRYMGICTDDYYKAAVKYIEEKVDSPVYYFFSDDKEFIKEHFIRNIFDSDSENRRFVIVDWNSGKDSLFDMQLMSCCRYNICANSTFSIWGARLNPYDEKVMIRPARMDNYESTTIEENAELWKNWVLIDNGGVIVGEQR